MGDDVLLVAGYLEHSFGASYMRDLAAGGTCCCVSCDNYKKFRAQVELLSYQLCEWMCCDLRSFFVQDAGNLAASLAAAAAVAAGSGPIPGDGPHAESMAALTLAGLSPNLAAGIAAAEADAATAQASYAQLSSLATAQRAAGERLALAIILATSRGRGEVT